VEECANSYTMQEPRFRMLRPCLRNTTLTGRVMSTIVSDIVAVFARRWDSAAWKGRIVRSWRDHAAREKSTLLRDSVAITDHRLAPRFHLRRSDPEIETKKKQQYGL
jgi:hypothetical protein